MKALRPLHQVMAAALMLVAAWSSPALATVITADPASAPAALADLAAGDELRLAAGVYSGVTFKSVKSWDPAKPIVVTSADPASPATITDFVVNDARGLIFRDLVLHTKSTNTRGYGFIFNRPQSLGFERVKVHGSLDGDPGNDPYGLQIRGGNDVWIVGSEFTELNRGLLVGATSKVRVEGSRFHLLRSDGMDFAQVQGVRIVGNEIRDIFRVGADHPDAIQFWTSGTTGPSTDIYIGGNLIDRGRGGPMQGIFIRDELGFPYERVTIENNLVIGTGWNALRIVGNANAPTRDVTVRGNEMITFDALEGVPTKELKTYILLQVVDGALVENNQAVQISFDRVTNLVDQGNVLTQPVADRGVVAQRAWTAARTPAAVRIAELEAALAAAEAQTSALVQSNEALQIERAKLEAMRLSLSERLAAIAAMAALAPQ